MELDELRTAWQEQNAAISALQLQNAALLRAAAERRARTPLMHLRTAIAVELAVTSLTGIWLGGFAYDQRFSPGLAASGIALALAALIVVQGLIRQLVLLADVRLDASMIAAQRALAHVQMVRVATAISALVLGPLLWLPIVAVAVRAVFGVDIYAALPARYLLVNAAFGAALIPAAIAAARSFGSAIRISSPWRAFADTIAGRSLTAARASVQQLDAFAASPEPA